MGAKTEPQPLSIYPGGSRKFCVCNLQCMWISISAGAGRLSSKCGQALQTEAKMEGHVDRSLVDEVG